MDFDAKIILEKAKETTETLEISVPLAIFIIIIKENGLQNTLNNLKNNESL